MCASSARLGRCLLSRAHYEHMALSAQARLAPGLTPEIFHYDESQALIVMELLEPHIIMRRGMIAGVRYPRFVDHITTFLARTLFLSSDLAVPAAQKKEGIAAFTGNHALCKITEDLIFTDPYFQAEQNRWTSPWLDATAAAFREDLDLHVAISRLKLKFMARPEALIHGDLHTGSIMVTEAETLVIDPEFAFYGPMGFDVGAVLGNLIMSYLASAGHERSPGERRSFEAWMLETIESVWVEFSRKFVELWRAGGNGDAYPHPFSPAKRARRGLKPNGRPTWSGYSGTPSGSPQQKSSVASSVSPTISISSGLKTRGFGRSARHEACASPAQ